MKSNRSMQTLYETIEAFSQKKAISEKDALIALEFLKSYERETKAHGVPEETIAPLCSMLVETLLKIAQEPFDFGHFHRKIPQFYTMGTSFVRHLIDFENSHLVGEENLYRMEEQLQRGENVILLSNHQTEIDPQIIILLLEEKHPTLAQDMIFVAGHRVIEDPLAIPISMGQNLLCIYSKKHIENPPELMPQKRLHNKKTMQVMSELLKEGGKCIWVAPSGGRDRTDATGVFQVDVFDPQSIEMFYLMSKRSATPTHFYTLALLAYPILPPPQGVQKEIGEIRQAHYSDVHLAFGDEVDMMDFPGAVHENKIEHRHQRGSYLWQKTKEDYLSLKQKSGKL